MLLFIWSQSLLQFETSIEARQSYKMETVAY